MTRDKKARIEKEELQADIVQFLAELTDEWVATTPDERSMLTRAHQLRNRVAQCHERDLNIEQSSGEHVRKMGDAPVADLMKSGWIDRWQDPPKIANPGVDR